jgi:glycosyltransferase involved in cell wall biosynthesis
MYQDAVLGRAAALRATSEMEADNIRRAGFSNPIAVVPNGVVLPEPPAGGLRSSDRAVRRALFMSRIHPKKGLLNLIEAWSCVRPSGWDLTIIGPDHEGHAQQVKDTVAAAGLNQSISVIGPVWGAERFRYYWESDLFVLPSFSENFAMVVAEALACETPVITTKGLPWKDLEQHQCGWWIEIGVEPLAEALRTATKMSDASRAQMGTRGRQLIEQSYTWDSSAKRMTEVYRWLMGDLAQPNWVRDRGT